MLEGNPSEDFDLSHIIIRTNDLGFDIVFDDADNKQILIVQSKWIGKNRSVDIGDLEKFYSIHDRLMDENIVRTASQQTQDLLDNYADKVRDGYTVLLRFVTNRIVKENQRRQELIRNTNERYQRDNAKVVCEFFAQSDLKEFQHQIATTDSGILNRIQ
ncbi:MAG: hypothetical protein F4003_08060, partial [Acidimicrobiaceae bacterium]|nr:hypothetical protein [Acidimicrobiaceae bacterium]